MRRSFILCVLLTTCTEILIGSPGTSQKHPTAMPVPIEFSIGRHTFFDFGPPFDFYELFVVRSSSIGTSIERITLIPAGNKCISPATLRIASALLDEPPAKLLGSTNPCTIPEKELRRELKRCKHCLVFSGANVVMKVECGTQTRLIRSDILDKDMFDISPRPPEHTSWTMGLLDRLDSAVGPGVIDTEKIFPIPGAEGLPPKALNSSVLQDLSAGKYDALFQSAPDKPSDLYRESQIPQPAPIVRLLGSTPLQPEVFVQPVYPPLARMTRVEGRVSIKFAVGDDGGATSLTFESGPLLLRGAVTAAVNQWRFPKNSSGIQIEATIEFVLNCPNESE